MNTTLSDAKTRLLKRFEAYLEQQMNDAAWTARLDEPSRYVLFGGGKRVRPLLALLAAEAVGSKPEAALPWAAAVEMVHTYSLVHDDLPAMDDDDERRGRATCHVKYDEALAILAGDALLTEAFAVLAEAPWPAERTVKLLALLAHAAGGAGMVGGQVHDIGGAVGDLASLEHMQRLKTGALIRAATVGGALAAGAGAKDLAALDRYARAMGLLFQLTDDLIDAVQDAERDGNSFLHHLSHDAVLARRDEVAAEAKAALTPLSEDAAAPLRELVTFIAQRTV